MATEFFTTDGVGIVLEGSVDTFSSIILLILECVIQFGEVSGMNFRTSRDRVCRSTATFLIWSICREHQRITPLGW